MKHKLMQLIPERGRQNRFTDRVGINDAYLGGETLGRRAVHTKLDLFHRRAIETVLDARRMKLRVRPSYGGFQLGRVRASRRLQLGARLNHLLLWLLAI